MQSTESDGRRKGKKKGGKAAKKSKPKGKKGKHGGKKEVTVTPGTAPVYGDRDLHVTPSSESDLSSISDSNANPLANFSSPEKERLASAASDTVRRSQQPSIAGGTTGAGKKHRQDRHDKNHEKNERGGHTAGKLYGTFDELSKTKTARITAWVDASDFGQTKLGPLVDPDDVAASQRRSLERKKLEESGVNFARSMVARPSRAVHRMSFIAPEPVRLLGGDSEMASQANMSMIPVPNETESRRSSQ